MRERRAPEDPDLHLTAEQFRAKYAAWTETYLLRIVEDPEEARELTARTFAAMACQRDGLRRRASLRRRLLRAMIGVTRERFRELERQLSEMQRRS
jgi:hypothetical protein